MKVLNIFFVLVIAFFISGCTEDEKKEQSAVNYKQITSFNEISENKMTFLFLSKPGCKWCKKLKEDFKSFQYINKYPEYDFVKIETKEPIFRQFTTSGFPVSSFPTLVIMQRNSDEFIVVEKIEGYVAKDVLEPILEFNKDLAK